MRVGHRNNSLSVSRICEHGNIGRSSVRVRVEHVFGAH